MASRPSDSIPVGTADMVDLHRRHAPRNGSRDLLRRRVRNQRDGDRDFGTQVRAAFVHRLQHHRRSPHQCRSSRRCKHGRPAASPEPQECFGIERGDFGRHGLGATKGSLYRRSIAHDDDLRRHRHCRLRQDRILALWLQNRGDVLLVLRHTIPELCDLPPAVSAGPCRSGCTPRDTARMLP